MNVSYMERRQFLFGWSTGCVEGMNKVFSKKKKKRFLVDLKMPISGRFALTEFDDKREREKVLLNIHLDLRTSGRER